MGFHRQAREALGTFVETIERDRRFHDRTVPTAAGRAGCIFKAKPALYEATLDNKVKAYKDNSASGGSLLTLVKTYSLAWKDIKRVWANGPRIFTQDANGVVTVYQQSTPASGTGTITAVGPLPASAALTEITSADSVWMTGSWIYTLKNGTVSRRMYSEPGVAGNVTPGWATPVRSPADSPTPSAAGAPGRGRSTP
ncbi:hypothetical protein ACF1AO_34455 [Streptomyces longwoodensis]|uniref:hypothetical protein n=1 Tax=Streptomyces longwoodensis TaxID=68231 RepID=UPI0036FAE91B